RERERCAPQERAPANWTLRRLGLLGAPPDRRRGRRRRELLEDLLVRRRDGRHDLVGRAALGGQPAPHVGGGLGVQLAQREPFEQPVRHVSIVLLHDYTPSSSARRPFNPRSRLRTPDTDRRASRATSSSVMPSTRCMNARLRVDAASGSSLPKSLPSTLRASVRDSASPPPSSAWAMRNASSSSS